MAKKTRRFLALVMALALCAGQLAIPAAAETTEPEAAPVVEVTVTELITEAVVTDEAGEIIESTTTKSEWSYEDPKGATVTGSEIQTDFTATDENGSKLYEGGTIEGSEVESLTTTETETTTEEDVLLSDETQQTSDAAESPVETKTEEGQWIIGATAEGQWIEGQLTEGEYVENAEMSGSEETSEDITIEEPDGDVTIQLTPNGKANTVTKTISLEEITEGNIEIPELGETSEDITDENGDVIGTVTTVTTAIYAENGTTVIGYEQTSISVEQTGHEETTGTPEETVKEAQTSVTVTLPEGVEAGTKGVYGENGEAIGTELTEIEEILDENGAVTGYRIIKTTTTNLTEETVAESSAPSTTVDAEPVVTIRLPEKPAASETVDEATGNKTTVAVLDILDTQGNVTGYEVVTTTVDAAGNTVSAGTEKLYGTVVTVTESIVTDPTTIKTTTENQIVEKEITEISAVENSKEIETVTTKLNEFINTVMTEKSYEFIEIDGQVYFVYTGEMSVAEGADHGDTSLMNPIAPQQSLINGKNLSGKDLYYKVNGGGGNYSSDANPNKDIPDDGFKLVGNGMASNLVVGTAKGYTTVHQFKLEGDDGKVFYAYCVDMATSARPGYFYDIDDISSQDYYQKDPNTTVDESVEKIRTIALNGFWGTQTGVGSMTDVRALVSDYLKAQGKTAEEIASITASLTEGQAVAATQAALWKYGSKSSDSSRVDENDLIKYYYNSGNYNSVSNSSTDYKNTEFIYNALLDSAKTPAAATNEGVEFLDASDITGGAITVKEKTYDAETGADTYNTDISFSLAIEPSKLNGDLLVSVMVGGEKVETYRLTDSEVLFNFGRIEPNADGSYTIENVELMEGVNVTLNLSGTQDLGTGVYVYTSEIKNSVSSQTLIGLASGERKVDLNVDMKFSVEKPEAEVKLVNGSETSGGTITDTRVDVKTDYRKDTKTDTTIQNSSSKQENGSIQTQAYADVTITQTVTEQTDIERSWKDSWLNIFEPEPTEPEPTEPEPTEPEPTEPEPTEPEPTEPEPTEPEPIEPQPEEPTPEPAPANDPGFPIPEPNEDDEIEIPDEDVPLAAVPKTGDMSMLWAVISGLSLGAMVIVNMKRDEE